MSKLNEFAAGSASATRAAKAGFVVLRPEQAARFLEAQSGVEDVDISDFQTLTEGAGASNGISLLTAKYTLNGEPVERGIVIRYMPGVKLIKQKDYGSEFFTMSALANAGLPVPQVLWLDAEGQYLGAPGYAMERVVGRSPDAAMFSSGLFAEVQPEARRSMMLQSAEFQGRLRREAIAEDMVPHLAHRGHGETAVRRELGWWLSEVEMARPPGERHRVALEQLHDWMCEHEPTLRAPSLVHGDSQFANFMFRDGKIAAVLDWELAYLGHNEADLALMIHLVETHGQDSELEGIPGEEELIAAYERGAGAAAEHLHYFKLVNLFKVMSIYLMLGEKLPNLDAIWDYHVALVEPLQRSIG